jgi:hypothetical protein
MLYRVFDFSYDPMLYFLEGPLSDKLFLSPRSFSACCKAKVEAIVLRSSERGI